MQSILDGHRDVNYDLDNDVVYLVNVDPGSPEFGEFMHLDIGNGNYPHVLERRDLYWPNDPRGESISLFFEETDEDLNKNGVLDPGEDSDADGILDQPNYLPGTSPDADDLAGRADALMTFYEKETNTLLIRPMMPLNERTTYAVVVTKRLLDANGAPVGSPYKFTNHASQTEALKPYLAFSRKSVSLLVTWRLPLHSQHKDWLRVKAVRDGLYGHGIQSHIAEEFPADVGGLEQLRDRSFFGFKISRMCMSFTRKTGTMRCSWYFKLYWAEIPTPLSSNASWMRIRMSITTLLDGTTRRNCSHVKTQTALRCHLPTRHGRKTSTA